MQTVRTLRRQVPNGGGRILLDSQSTVNIFSNSAMVRNVRKANKRLALHCNAGTSYTNMIGDSEHYGTVWFNPDGIANIISLTKAEEELEYDIQYEPGGTFIVNRRGSGTDIYQRSQSGLHFVDVNDNDHYNLQPSDDSTDNQIVLVNTVTDNDPPQLHRDACGHPVS